METIIENNLNSIAIIESTDKDQETLSIDQEDEMHQIKSKCNNSQDGINLCHLFMSNNFKQLEY